MVRILDRHIYHNRIDMSTKEELNKVFDKIDNAEDELTNEEVELLCDWVEGEIEKLNG